MTIDEIQETVYEWEDKALHYAKSMQDPAVEYVGKAAKAFADAIPDDRPEAVTQGIEEAVHQVAFAKRVIDTETAFVKAVLDAAVKPFKPLVPAKKRTAKAA